MKITVVGIGYVGLANAILLAQNNIVTLLDVDKEKVYKINNGISPIDDCEIKEYLNKNINLKATLDKKEAYEEAEYIVVAAPTNYDERTNFFDTQAVDNVVKDIIHINTNTVIILKSTLPIGYTEKMKSRLGIEDLIFAPEFLREGRALYDNLYPSRIVIGSNSQKAQKFVELLIEGAIRKEVDIVYTGSTEAETIKLFANTYLAMRVAFFNELDIYAEERSLNTQQIIKGICLDSRIGDYYNNPSFGYGGYCLPKDTKQLLADFGDIPNTLIKAIVEANDTRKTFIASKVLKSGAKTIGIYRLTMKAASDNFRQSAIQDIIKKLEQAQRKILIYEPFYKKQMFLNGEIIRDFKEFTKKSDIILANRMSNELLPVKEKVYTRDLYFRD
ncbi:nucleotide sugar dehydrogenase [Clostridiales bacterium TF09-2AC]|uniref:nucleotide sugar dehydrogenase n=1 Tax=Enterocloster hominis (ex Hitch et al. 2024) TaxID=1917870 RepID=UPI000E70C30C|nr:nucleotide sugar dehydrogenase [Lachnoclostridium pacaense]MCC2878534.1 nucleotide sugar dehydrogenase [Lachnoclostridium pacaense]RJW37285.1 nucleotide sugar dehydrogenase [Clostridiales bacterium TF09-2AC]